jgi:hypothetical protein
MKCSMQVGIDIYIKPDLLPIYDPAVRLACVAMPVDSPLFYYVSQSIGLRLSAVWTKF